MSDRRWNEFALAALGIVLGGALIYAVSHTLCPSPMADTAIEKGEAACCAEFWLNRYQALIAALVAFGVAVAAYLVARGQLLATERTRLRSEQELLARRMSEIMTYRNDVVDLGNAFREMLITIDRREFGNPSPRSEPTFRQTTDALDVSVATAMDAVQRIADRSRTLSAGPSFASTMIGLVPSLYNAISVIGKEKSLTWLYGEVSSGEEAKFLSKTREQIVNARAAILPAAEAIDDHLDHLERDVQAIEQRLHYSVSAAR